MAYELHLVEWSGSKAARSDCYMPGSASKSVFSAVLSRSQPKVRRWSARACRSVLASTSCRMLPSTCVAALTVCLALPRSKLVMHLRQQCMSHTVPCSQHAPPPLPSPPPSPTADCWQSVARAPIAHHDQRSHEVQRSAFETSSAEQTPMCGTGRVQNMVKGLTSQRRHQLPDDPASAYCLFRTHTADPSPAQRVLPDFPTRVLSVSGHHQVGIRRCQPAQRRGRRGGA